MGDEGHPKSEASCRVEARVRDWPVHMVTGDVRVRAELSKALCLQFPSSAALSQLHGTRAGPV